MTAFAGLLVEVLWPETPEITEAPPDEDAKAALAQWTTVALISMKAVARMHGIDGPFILDPRTGRWRVI